MARLTTIGQNLIAAAVGNGPKLTISKFVFANIPGLDHTAPESVDEPMPLLANIVFSRAPTKAGLLDENRVTYSQMMLTDVGDFSFNWIGLVYTDPVAGDQLVMFAYVPLTQKIKTQGASAGNVLTRNMVIEHLGIANATPVVVSAESWMFDINSEVTLMNNRIDQIEVEMQRPRGEIGDVVTSLLSIDSDGRALLPMMGQVINADIYPKLSAVIGPKLNVNSVTEILSDNFTQSGCHQTLNGRYIFSMTGLTLNRLDVDTGIITAIATLTQGLTARFNTSPDGRMIVINSGGLPGQMQGTDTTAQVIVSNDYGASFSPPYSYQFDKSESGNNIIISADEQKIWFLVSSNANGDRVLYSDNAGISWIYKVHTSYSPSYLTEAEPDGSRIYGSRLISDTVLSSNNGQTWVKSYNSGLFPPGTHHDQFMIDRVQPNNRVCRNFDDKTWDYSTDSNATWHDMVLPVAVTSIRQLIVNDGELFLTTNYAELFISSDFGNTWISLGWLNPEGADRTAISTVNLPKYFNNRGINNYLLASVSPTVLKGYKRATIDVSASLPVYGDIRVDKVIADKVI
ncbi:phage tail protein [Shewanella baltica]|uniref:phage tail-collar fiber domain-containing protein n=1 Tax=Shewanella baltica TaxID=62322 RepID=UPI0039AF5DF2